MQLSWWQLLLLALLQLAALAVSAPFSRRWSAFNHHYRNFKPFKPKPARFAAPIHGFSNIFQDNGISRWSGGTLPSIRRAESWSRYPSVLPQMQPIPLSRNRYQSFPIPPPTAAPSRRRQHQFVPASSIQGGKVPTEFMTDAVLHGLVCVPASSLATALAGHRDRVTRNRDGSVTTHRTVLAGTDGRTSHSTRITSANTSTVVETRTNSSSGVQHHRQAVQRTGSGVVRSSTGSAFSEGRRGLPGFADVVTSSTSDGGSSQSRASASGYDTTGQPIPFSSTSHSSSSGADVAASSPPSPGTQATPQLPQGVAPSETAATAQAPRLDVLSGLQQSSEARDGSVPPASGNDEETTAPEVKTFSQGEVENDGEKGTAVLSGITASQQEDTSSNSEDEVSSMEDDAFSALDEDQTDLQGYEAYSRPEKESAPPQNEDAALDDYSIRGYRDEGEQQEELPETEIIQRSTRRERVAGHGDVEEEGAEEE